MNADNPLGGLLLGVVVGYLRANGVSAEELHAMVDSACSEAQDAIDGDPTRWNAFASQVETAIKGGAT